jgi:polysaccharide biosynthesis protein VpsJ
MKDSFKDATPQRAAQIADALLEQCKRDDFAGFDPFDALNSAFFDRLGGNRWPLGRIAWLQLHKRSPINLRPLFSVPKRRNPKGIALIILGLVERCRSSRSPDDMAIAVELGEWLLTQSADLDSWGHRAWGYHFDWAARAFYVPRGKPNAITTCYVARALYALGDLTGNANFTNAAIDAGFFLDSLYLEHAGANYYAYIPGETAFVHNASLWSAALVCEAAVRVRNDAMRDRALEVARQSVHMQRPDGAWAYGTRSHHAFIDGFHTGYNLEALSLLKSATGVSEFDGALEAGMNYYRARFFLPDGTVKYYNDRVWPVDTHSVSQAILTLIRVGGTADDLVRADQVIDRAISTLYVPDKKRFLYQKGRWLNNSVNYLRWTQAWAFYALSVYAAYVDGNGRVSKTL